MLASSRLGSCTCQGCHQSRAARRPTRRSSTANHRPHVDGSAAWFSVVDGFDCGTGSGPVRGVIAGVGLPSVTGTACVRGAGRGGGGGVGRGRGGALCCEGLGECGSRVCWGAGAGFEAAVVTLRGAACGAAVFAVVVGVGGGVVGCAAGAGSVFSAGLAGGAGVRGGAIAGASSSCLTVSAWRNSSR